MPGSKSTARIKKTEFARIIFTEPRLPRYKAAERAGYTGSMKVLSTAASRLVDDAVVLAELANLKIAADAEAIVDYDRVTKYLDEILSISLADFIDDNDHFIPPSKWTPAMKASGVKMKMRRERNRRRDREEGDDEWQEETHIIEIELPRRDRIVEMLGKLRHVGAFSTIVETQGTGGREKWLKDRAEREASNRGMPPSPADPSLKGA